MEFYGDASCCHHAPEAAPVEVYEPAPLPAYEPPAPVPAATEIFPAVPAAPVAASSAAPVAAVTDIADAPPPQAVPEPSPPAAAFFPTALSPTAEPMAATSTGGQDSTISAGTSASAGELLGPSTVGGGSSGWAVVDSSGAAVDPGSILGPTIVGGTGGGWTGPDASILGPTTVGGMSGADGTWLSAGAPLPDLPPVPGPWTASTVLALVTGGQTPAILGMDSTSTGMPAPWTPGYDNDHDGTKNEYDNRPLDRRTW